MISCALLTIGTELTRGDLQDQNGFWLAGKLAELGLEVLELRTIDDDLERISSALFEIGERYDIVIVTGGLGPTSDDLTSAAAARATGTDLVRDPGSVERIKSAFSRAGVPMHPMNEKQADFPSGAVVLENDLGTAPGFSCRIGRATAFFTPGVPREMKHLFFERIAPRLPAPAASLHVERLTVFGLPESSVAGRIESVERSFPVILGYRAGSHEIEVKVQGRAAPGEPETEVRATVLRAYAAVQELLSGAFFAPGRVRLAEFFGTEFRRLGLTVGFAESCTGGLTSHLVTSVPGSSDYFLGSVTSYDNRVKRSLLGVPEDILSTVGAVSAECARAMARGAQTALGVEVAIAITGIAGPGGGTPEKPVGLVHFCAVRGETVLERTRTFRGDRAQIQARAATQALVLGLEVLREESA